MIVSVPDLTEFVQAGTTDRPPAKSVFNQSLWDFSVDNYAKKDVEALCLSLQREYHVNVNIMLWCCWMRSEGIELSSSWLDDILIKIDTVSQLTVASLREVRKQLKNSGCFTKVQAKTISKHILNAELLLEKVLLHRIQDLTRRFIELDQQEKLENPQALNLKLYLEFMQVPNAGFYSQKLLSLCDGKKQLV